MRKSRKAIPEVTLTHDGGETIIMSARLEIVDSSRGMALDDLE